MALKEGTELEELSKNFFGLEEIAVSSLYTHIREKCYIGLKQASKHTAERDSPRTLDLRRHIVTQWKAVGVDFLNCVYLLMKQDFIPR